ncbi:MAG TPA: H-NS histone family protein [Tahibacter sp.]|uniref:H-NS histone family protein n=1 Tax=Tahibacter sp. TaxID=2056211 RepID=UPI002CA3102F|nr:H-NS histone family protein [Tahibacter sp.]HSX60939.1 H-NS histone family protein [Tahibacter sp.]
MAIDLDSLTSQQLADLIAQANQRQQEMQREHAAEVRARLVAIARKEGFTIEELFGQFPARKRTVKPKYRNPLAPGETWSGRGKQPRWFSAALSTGLLEEDLLIR